MKISKNTTIVVIGSRKISHHSGKVLNLYNTRKIISVSRFGSGIGHTLGSNVDILNSKINIPVKTRKFESKVITIEILKGISDK